MDRLLGGSRDERALDRAISCGTNETIARVGRESAEPEVKAAAMRRLYGLESIGLAMSVAKSGGAGLGEEFIAAAVSGKKWGQVWEFVRSSEPEKRGALEDAARREMGLARMIDADNAFARLAPKPARSGENPLPDWEDVFALASFAREGIAGKAARFVAESGSAAAIGSFCMDAPERAMVPFMDAVLGMRAEGGKDCAALSLVASGRGDAMARQAVDALARRGAWSQIVDIEQCEAAPSPSREWARMRLSEAKAKDAVRLAKDAGRFAAMVRRIGAGEAAKAADCVAANVASRDSLSGARGELALLLDAANARDELAGGILGGLARRGCWDAVAFLGERGELHVRNAAIALAESGGQKDVADYVRKYSKITVRCGMTA
jgi:hypothetical protein